MTEHRTAALTMLTKFKDALIGVLYALAFVVTLLALLFLGGCASLPEGVRMDKAERAACAAEGCSVWTDTELRALIQHFLMQGYQQGRAAGKGGI